MKTTCFLLCLSLNARASVLRDIEFAFEAGRDQLAGALTANSSSPSHGLHALFWAPAPLPTESFVGSLTSFFDLSLVRMGNPDARTSHFPFKDQSEVVMTRSVLAPHVCAWSESLIYPCLGVGYGLLDLEQGEENTQTYGVFLYSLYVRHDFAKSFSLSLHTDWSRLVMTTDREKSFLETWNSALMLGYRF